jgi:hypothetical protein
MTEYHVRVKDKRYFPHRPHVSIDRFYQACVFSPLQIWPVSVRRWRYTAKITKHIASVEHKFKIIVQFKASFEGYPFKARSTPSGSRAITVR